MIRLNLRREARWVELAHGLRLLCEPLTTAMHHAARTVSHRHALEAKEAGRSAEEAAAAGGAEYIACIARQAVRDWDGVLDAEGAPAALTPEGIDAVMAIPGVSAEFDRRYVTPGLSAEIVVAAEKNVSPPSPNGTTAGAPGTAQPAPTPEEKPARSALTH